jgi:hypothetical protein
VDGEGVDALAVGVVVEQQEGGDAVGQREGVEAALAQARRSRHSPLEIDAHSTAWVPRPVLV